MYVPAKNYQNGPWIEKVIAKIKWCSFYRAVWNAGGPFMRKLTVRPSFRPSVCLSNAWIVTKRKKALPRFLYHMNERVS